LRGGFPAEQCAGPERPGAKRRERADEGAVSKTEPFDRMVDLVARGGGGHPVWGQRGARRTGAFDERRFRKALREYWGPEADPMRVSLSVQDAAFVSGVMRTVSEHLALAGDDQRRATAAVVRSRLLGEPEPGLADVDAAWRAWWPPPPGDDGRVLFTKFIDAWRDWLAASET
jgi:hypothetical protein